MLILKMRQWSRDRGDESPRTLFWRHGKGRSKVYVSDTPAKSFALVRLVRLRRQRKPSKSQELERSAVNSTLDPLVGRPRARSRGRYCQGFAPRPYPRRNYVDTSVQGMKALDTLRPASG